MAKKAPQRRAVAPRQTRRGAGRLRIRARSVATASLKVRMYRQGLGDCFLVTLPKQDGLPFYILIDCGVVLGTSKPEAIMRAVVSNIIDVTGGRVDVLVVTNEHFDHVSGFVQVQELFAKQPEKGKLSVGEVWFAWTEDPSDALATRLRRERQARVNKLAGFVAAMHESGAVENEDVKNLVDGVDGLLSFFGMDKGKAKARAGGTRPAMKFAGELANIRYCRPTDKPVELPDVPGIRVYVLGPPADETLLRKTDSTKEVYHLANLGAMQSFFSATLALPAMGDAGDEEQWQMERHQPFEPQTRHELDALKQTLAAAGGAHDSVADFFDRCYFGRSSDPMAPDQAWRRIDDDWMGAAAEFALQLDSATNNTSLVLAFELTNSGKVLLFAADAQVGNWLSWQDLKWKVDANTVTGPDLLERTVFYKVAHHGSHNATLRTKGLELMRSDDLVAFIPVDHAMAVKKHWGRMPLPNLTKELERRTQGRVVRIDKDYQPEGSKALAFARALTKDKLFYEWEMPIG